MLPTSRRTSSATRRRIRALETVLFAEAGARPLLAV
jgi:hypothetical protein